jgi:hypothetical protein
MRSHHHFRSVVVIQSHPFFVNRPFFVTRPFFAQRFVFVQRPFFTSTFFAPSPVIVQPGTSFFVARPSVVIVR